MTFLVPIRELRSWWKLPPPNLERQINLKSHNHRNESTTGKGKKKKKKKKESQPRHAYLKKKSLQPESAVAAAAAAKSLQSCPTLCDPIDGSPPGFPVPGILQARTLEWVAISFSSAWKWKVKVKSLSRVQLLVTPRTAAYQAPPSMRFSRQKYWSGVPLPFLQKVVGRFKW